MAEKTQLDDIELRWALRDVLAHRHKWIRTSEAALNRLRELGWVKESNGELVLTDAGHEALR
ncbi:MAG: hypothetical protein CFE29_01705 [Bradyrhizobiaceae bacterium PARB1]|jgi:hypothetical protein|nr:MAG: hypothetical protein CFE29_01705 [Bradyrhizobiaceae bacterium PARB1]